MKLPRDISGQALIRVLIRDFGYRKVHQVGSHVVLETDHPTSHRVAVPDHKALRVGTLNNILRAVAGYKDVSRDAILKLLR